MVISDGAGWEPFEEGGTVGAIGSEGGQILLDQVHSDGARITLERIARSRGFLRRPRKGFAITCGVFGWMVHTRFFLIEEDARQQFELMKTSLTSILNALPLESDPAVEQHVGRVSALLAAFVAEFP